MRNQSKKVNRNIMQKLRNKNPEEIIQKLEEIKSFINKKITTRALEASIELGASSGLTYCS